MAKPTFVAVYEPSSNWGQTGDAASRVTSSFNVLANDILVIMASAEDVAFTIDTPPTGGSLTYTLQEDVDPTENCEIKAWSATVDSDKSMTVTCVCSGSAGNRHWGFIVYHFRASNGIGASEKADTVGSTLAITTTQANSAIVTINADWNAVDGATRTWRTINSITPTSGNGLEKVYFRSAADYAVYSAYWDDAGTAAAKTTGLSAPTGQQAAMASIEVKGSAASSQTITGSLFTNSQTFFTASVSKDIAGALFSDSDSFQTAVLTVGAVNISGGLFTNSAAFHTAVLTTGVVDIAGSLFVDGDTFQTAILTYNVNGSLFVDGDVFQTSVLTTGSVNIAGSLFVDGDTFFTAEVSVGSGTQGITGSLFVESDSFQTAIVSSTYNIVGDLFVESDAFQTSVLSADYPISGTLFIDLDVFETSILTTTVGISGNLFVESDVFQTAVVTQSLPISGSLFDDPDTFYSSSTSSIAFVAGSLFVDPDVFYTSDVSGGVSEAGSGGIIYRRRRR